VTDNLPSGIAFSFVRSGSVLVWSAMRPWSASWCGSAGLFAEVFAVVIAAAILTRYAAVPALQWLAVRLP
jgi:hypothetical protein